MHLQLSRKVQVRGQKTYLSATAITELQDIVFSNLRIGGISAGFRADQVQGGGRLGLVLGSGLPRLQDLEHRLPIGLRLPQAH